MFSKQRFVLSSLCEGELSFNDASEILKQSITEVEKLLDDFNWIPSAEYIEQNYPERMID